MIKLILVLGCIALGSGFEAFISKNELIHDDDTWTVTIETDAQSECSVTAEPPTAVVLYCNNVMSCNCTATKPLVSYTGLISFEFSGEDISHSLALRIKRQDESALYTLSTSSIQVLLDAKYHYLAISHGQRAYSSYHPKVADFFQDRFQKTAEMIFTITEYIKMKQAAIGELKPDFHSYMIRKGFLVGVPGMQARPTGIVESFKEAIRLDQEVLAQFTTVSLLADQEGDEELHEFVTNDVIPLYTSSLKILSNHLSTLSKMTSSDEATMTSLANFMFDKLI